MINSPPSCSSLYSEAQMEPACETSSLDSNAERILLNIIESRISDRYEDYGYDCDKPNHESLPKVAVANIISYKKWKSTVNNGFKSLIEMSIASFSKKLIDINCGSFDEKKLFLNAVSGGISSCYPFRVIKNSIISFVEERISLPLVCDAEIMIEAMREEGNNDYSLLSETILKKAKETLLDKDIGLSLTRLISNVISNSCMAHLTENEKSCAEKIIKTKLKLYLNIETMPFAMFTDLYLDHLAENYDEVMSKSIEVLDKVAEDAESCMSLVFDSFLGHGMFNINARKLRSILCSSASYLKRSIMILSSPSNIHLGNLTRVTVTTTSGRLRLIISRSQRILTEKMKSYFSVNCVVVINEGLICACNEEFIKKVITSASSHLETMV
ncbi:hypothetical protein Ark11_1312 [Candidatus Ichthyocystis hellenicum]|uniref:Uncharacterized protein n=1 Tax=Candidatus Ichthyocystis hellenicum TaxID=1561003 RepID=A0A0S4M9H5_9BURK|nr:hypothetical protein [Candidatus Ichthyocystis hellenicum]CUT18116.1 hypothetical protein Ark11_1312 [Candidatus Ichthyocystis hellenicum]